MERLRHAASELEGSDLDELCDGMVSSLVHGDHLADDIALVAMRPRSDASGQLSLTLPAEPRALVGLRRAFRQWLRDSAVTAEEETEILIACGEACANVVRHAYPTSEGEVVLEARIVDSTLTVTVRDHGTWRPAADREGGWGLQLIRDLMDTVDVVSDPTGSVVTMRRRLQAGRRGR